MTSPISASSPSASGSSSAPGPSASASASSGVTSSSSAAMFNHKKTVYCLDIIDDTLYTGCADGKARAFDLNATSSSSPSPVATFAGHSSPITCLALVRHPALPFPKNQRQPSRSALLPSHTPSSSSLSPPSLPASISSSSSSTNVTADQPSPSGSGAPPSLYDLRSYSSTSFCTTTSSQLNGSLRDTLSLSSFSSRLPFSFAEESRQEFLDYPLYLITASNDKTVRVWNTQTQECIRVLKKAHSSYIYCMHVDVERGKLYTGAGDHLIVEWDMAFESRFRIFKGHTDWVRDLCQPPGSKVLYSASNDGTVRKWNLDTGLCEATVSNEASRAFCLAYGDANRLFIGMSDKHARCIDSRNGAVIAQFLGHKGPVLSMALAPSLLVTGSGDKSVKCWDVATGKCLATFVGHSDWVRCVKIHNYTIFSASDDGTVRMWKVNPADLDSALDDDTFSVRSGRSMGSQHSSHSHQDYLHRGVMFSPPDTISLSSSSSSMFGAGIGPSYGVKPTLALDTEVSSLLRARVLELEKANAEQYLVIQTLQQQLKATTLEKNGLQQSLQESQKSVLHLSACLDELSGKCNISPSVFLHIHQIKSSVNELESELAKSRNESRSGSTSGSTSGSSTSHKNPSSCAGSISEDIHTPLRLHDELPDSPL